MPFEVASCSVNPRSGLWHVAHAVELSAERRVSKNSVLPRATFSGVCALSAGTEAAKRSRGSPGWSSDLGSAGGPVLTRQRACRWKSHGQQSCTSKVVNIGAMRLGPSARRGKTPPPVNAATARQPLTLSAAQMDDVVPSAVASAMGLADGLSNLERRRQPSYSAPRTQSRAVPLPSAFRQHRCWRRRQRSPILGGRASTVVFRHWRHAKIRQWAHRGA